ncbi:hypothetical protein [Aquimarina macrocephali]|uniref:hypothetical protein n=1 Tax=Aquimarina macrocephali TaxID=666563 RepID=UPI003F673763
MKYILNNLILILTLVSTKAIACNCAIPKSLKAIQDHEFENSECIFIGEIIKIDSENNSFEIKVIESFNGDEIGKTYSGIYDKYCGPIIDEKGKWLIYGNLNSENLIKINTCGLTRSLKNPENNISATIPPEPLAPNETGSKAKFAKQRVEWKIRAKSNLEKEIIDLRKRIK